MKKYVMLVALCVLANVAWAQLINAEQGEKKQSELDWYNCSFDRDSVYGAEVNKAYEFLKDKKIKKRPVVALIGSGIDVLHEDLKEAIWVNPKEKDNGKDGDKDGLIGDVNGWNFLGGKDGAIMENTMYEGDREFFRYKDEYGDYFTDGVNFFKIVDGKKTKVAPPADMNKYEYYRMLMQESELAGAYGGIQVSYLILEYARQFDKMLRDSFPNQKLTQKEFGICYNPKKTPRDSLSEVAFMFLVMTFQIQQTDSWDAVYDNYKEGQQIALSKQDYEEKLAKLGTDHRKEIVGDDYLNINDKGYGNNVLLTPDASVGTVQAGVIGAKRDNGTGVNGIMDEAEIMTLRVQGEEGNPYLKDMALAIRYAVDHGADIVLLPEQNTLYPPDQIDWISDALLYAETKGVLVIVPAWEYSVDLSKITFYPNRWMAGDKELTNLMVVSSSDRNGNPSMNSNYGAKEVDLYAPGIDIYTAYTGDTYQMTTGVGLAGAATAGVAALIKAYYPELSGSQIRNLLIDNVTSRKGVEVEKGIRVNMQQSQDLFIFDDLCIAGGILNAYQAVVAADKLTK